MSKAFKMRTLHFKRLAFKKSPKSNQKLETRETLTVLKICIRLYKVGIIQPKLSFKRNTFTEGVKHICGKTARKKIPQKSEKFSNFGCNTGCRNPTSFLQFKLSIYRNSRRFLNQPPMNILI